MNKKYFSLLALMTLSLVGCTQPIEQIQPSPQPVRNLPTTATQIKIPITPTIETSDLGVIITDGNPTNVPEVNPSVSPTGLQKPTLVTTESSDQKIYSQAVKNKDSKLCELIKNADTKATCVRDTATPEESNPKAVVTTDQGSTSQENLNQ